MTKYKIISGGALSGSHSETVIELRLNDAIKDGWVLVKFEFKTMTHAYEEVMGFALLKRETDDE